MPIKPNKVHDVQISNLKKNYFCFVFSCLIGKFTCKFQKISTSLLAGTKCYVKKARRFLFLTEKQPFSDKYQKLFSLTCCCFSNQWALLMSHQLGVIRQIPKSSPSLLRDFRNICRKQMRMVCIKCLNSLYYL